MKKPTPETTNVNVGLLRDWPYFKLVPNTAILHPNETMDVQVTILYLTHEHFDINLRKSVFIIIIIILVENRIMISLHFKYSNRFYPLSKIDESKLLMIR